MDLIRLLLKSSFKLLLILLFIVSIRFKDCVILTTNVLRKRTFKVLIDHHPWIFEMLKEVPTVGN